MLSVTEISTVSLFLSPLLLVAAFVLGYAFGRGRERLRVRIVERLGGTVSGRARLS